MDNSQRGFRFENLKECDMLFPDQKPQNPVFNNHTNFNVQFLLLFTNFTLSTFATNNVNGIDRHNKTVTKMTDLINVGAMLMFVNRFFFKKYNIPL